MPIVIKINNTAKIISLWCTKEDLAAAFMPGKVHALCQEYRTQKYLIAVYYSGEEELYSNTFGILKHNKQILANQEIPKDMNAAENEKKEA